MSGGEEVRFVWQDYVVFGAVLVISALIGVLFGFLGRKKNTDAKDFLTGGGEMHFLPVSLSMMASFMSAIFVISIPAEMYIFGSTYAYLAVSYFIGFPISAHFFLPVFYKLKLTSAYEYLEMRFSRAVRLCGSMSFAGMIILYMAVVLYAPALALSQVSGLPIVTSILSVGLVVTFYTALGGMRATIWNDAFQMIVIFASFLICVIIGADKSGGFEHAMQVAKDGGRLNMDKFDPDPFERSTFWTVVIGGTFVNITLYASSQNTIQKFISCRSIKHGQIAVWLSCFTTAGYMMLVMLIGCIAYAFYVDCDPLASNRVEKNDQLIPLFVLETMSDYPGLPGLYISAAFSATLSTISGGVNGLAAVFLEDIIKPWYQHRNNVDLPARMAAITTRCLAIFFGLVNVAMAFAAEFFGDLVLTMALSIFGMVGAPVAGLITLGIFFPCANNYGALAGFVASLGLTNWIAIGSMVEKPPQPLLNTSIAGCDFSMTSPVMVTEVTEDFYSTEPPLVDEEWDGLKIYQLSYMYYSIFAILVCCIVGLFVSLITGGNKKLSEQNPLLFHSWSDACYCCCPRGVREKCRCGVEDSDSDVDLDDVTMLESATKNGYVKPVTKFNGNMSSRDQEKINPISTEFSYKRNLSNYMNEAYIADGYYVDHRL